MPEASSQLPVPFVPIDINKPLFDTRGNSHMVVMASMFQLLTTYRGLFFVWDRSSGESLMKVGPEYRLSNDPLPQRPSAEPVTAADRSVMSQSTMVIDCLRRSSRADLAARARAHASKS